MRVTYLGHAATLIELGGMTVVTDPVVRSRVAHLRRIAPAVATDTLVGVDLILLSHAHHDHLDVRSLKALPSSPPVICPLPAVAAVRRAGLHCAIARAGSTLERGGLSIEVVEARHDGRRWPTAAGGESVGYVVDDGEHRVYFAGDTEIFEGLRAIDDIDVALIPVAGWGPRLGAGHMGPAEAAEATAMLMPRTVVPIHWGTYRRILMRGNNHANHAARKFAEELSRRAPAVRSVVLQPGEALSSDGGAPGE